MFLWMYGCLNMHVCLHLCLYYVERTKSTVINNNNNNNNNNMTLSSCPTVVISIIISIIYRVKQIHKHRLPYLREYAPPRAEVYEGTYFLNTIKNKSSSITWLPSSSIIITIMMMLMMMMVIMLLMMMNYFWLYFKERVINVVVVVTLFSQSINQSINSFSIQGN